MLLALDVGNTNIVIGFLDEVSESESTPKKMPTEEEYERTRRALEQRYRAKAAARRAAH